jgi:organic radical activating enzyme
LLAETFYSVQGEGKNVGTPSLFARFGGCNLECKGFGCEFISPADNSKLIGCDSIFAVERKHFSSFWERYDDSQKLFDKITEPISDLRFLPNIVITGGEPLIYHNDNVFYGFLNLLLKRGFKVFIETNASVNIDFCKFKAYKQAYFSMSVKLSNSGEKYEKRVNKNAVANIAQNSKEAFFKFVLDKKMIKSGLAKKEIEDITNGVEASVFCMPLGKNNKEINRNGGEVVKFCLENGYNYTDRIHIRLWGDKRGV